MCGIAGVVTAGESPSREHLEAMATAIRHRGPDDAGVFVDGPCGLSFRRLSIIDLALGHQPMTSGPATVVFNGEIYNHLELRRTLEALGHVFLTRSDTEVLLHAYLQWGRTFIGRLHGMFAFAIWDSRTRSLLCARDRFGKKPLYYAWNGRRLLFGSELKALLAHPDCPRDLDPAALRRYLVMENVPTPDCIIAGVRKLEEGTSLVLEDGQLRLEPYYVLPRPEESAGLPGLLGASVDELAGQLRDELGAAVERRLFADVPVGVFLSGGIDSSAVAALARRAGGTVKTFSVAFSEAAFDESPYARRVAQALGTEHHEERLSGQEAVDLVPRLADQLDEPFADPSYLPTFLLSRFTRQHVTVALGGDGADELFMGYDTFVAHGPARIAAAAPSRLRSWAVQAVSRLPPGEGYMTPVFRLQRFLDGVAWAPAYRHQVWIAAMNPRAADALLVPELRSADPVAEVFGPLDGLVAGKSAGTLAAAQLFYFRRYLRDDILVKVDRASMAASLEVRSPFLDTRVVEFALALPWAMKLRGLTRKYLLRRALQGVVPDEVLRRKKHGFAIPVTGWLRGPLRELVLDVFSPQAIRRAGLLDPAPVLRLVEEHLEGRADHRKPLWTLLQLELWRRRWLGS